MDFTVSISPEDIDAIASRVVELMARSEMQAKDLYSPEDLAERYGLSRATILQRMREGAFGQLVGSGRKKMVTAEGLKQYESRERAAETAQPARRYTHRANPGKI